MTRRPISEMPVVYRAPGIDRVRVHRDIPYATGSASQLRLDAYYPPQVADGLLPAVVLVTGYSDVGAREHLGCGFREVVAYVDWARMLAASGIVAITYENEDPVPDADRVFEFLRAHGAELGMDASVLGVWSCSGNVPTALAIVARNHAVRAAALCYGYLPDVEGHDATARAAAQFGFANPDGAFDFDVLARVSLLIVHAGRDEMPGLDESMNRFTGRAHERSAPLTVERYAAGAHAFDLLDASEAACDIIRRVPEFLSTELRAASNEAVGRIPSR